MRDCVLFVCVNVQGIISLKTLVGGHSLLLDTRYKYRCVVMETSSSEKSVHYIHYNPLIII